MIQPERKFSVDNYRYGFQKQEKDDEISGEGNTISFTFRVYDTRIGRFLSVDPIDKKYPELTPYQFASNSPISMLEFEGLEGIKYQEVDEKGKLIRHVITQNVYVVVVDKWDKKGTGKRRPKDRVESNYDSEDIAKIKDALNYEFNGSAGQGSSNSKGETVFYSFNIMELRIGHQDETTEADLMIRASTELATESDDVNFNDWETGEPVFKKSVANILLGGGSAAAYAEGANNGVRTRLSEGKEFDYGVILHEMLHQLINRPGEKEHELGGGLATPAESINSKNVDATLKDALQSKLPKWIRRN